MKVAIYCRVSTDKQELDQQIASCRRLCDYKGYEIAAVYSEIGSGAKSTRPQYLKMVGELRKGLYDAVVVFRLDRLGRDARELSLLIEELENRGIKVLSVSENFDTSTAIGRGMRSMVMVFAEMERGQIAEATVQRLQSLKAAGKRLGQKPCSDYQVNKVKEMAATGLSSRKIAKEMQISHVTVNNIVNRKGYYSVVSENAKV